MQCVILAGGLGTRMRPATETVPKALLPVCDRPFVDHQLAWLAGHGVQRVVLSIGYLGHMLREHVGDGARFGLEVDYVDEGGQLRGTAGALRLALEQGALESAFLLTYGDSFLPVDFEAVWRAFRESRRPALMTVFHNAGRWDTSNVVFDRARGMVELYDKTRRDRPVTDYEFIDYGLLGFDRGAIEAGVPADGGKHDLAGLLRGLSVEGRLAGMEVSERFYEVGSPAGLRDLEERLRTAGAAR